MTKTNRSLVVMLSVILMGAATLLSVFSCKPVCDKSVEEAEIASLQAKLDSIMLEHERLKGSNPQAAGAMSKKDSLINAQAAEIQGLIKQLNDAKAASKGDATAKNSAELEKAKKELAAKTADLKKIQAQLDKQTKELNECRKQASSTKQGNNSNADAAKLASLQKQIDQQQRQIRDYSNQVAQLNKKITELNSQKSGSADAAALRTKNNELNNQVASLQRQLDEAKRKAAAAPATDNKAQQQVEQYRKQISQLESQTLDLKKQVSTLQSQLTEAEARGNAAGSQDASKIAQLESNLASLQSRTDQYEAQVATLTQQLEACNARANNTEVATPAAPAGNDNSSQIASLTQQLESQKAEIAQLNSTIQNKDKELTAALAAAENAKKEAEAAKNASTKTTVTATGKGAAAINQKLEELQNLCASYEAEIARLTAENTELKAQNVQLREDLSNQQRDCEKTVSENARLEQKVALASILVTSDLVATPAKKVVGATVTETDKANKVEAVKIDFKILDNNVIDPGTITLYARIASTNNRVICNREDQTFEFNGVETHYTVKQDIEFTGYGRKVAMVWRRDPSYEMAPGTYNVSVFANGSEIGQTKFTVK